MIKVSAAYSYCNPNFVIQNLDEPKKWSHPVFAVLKNILMRGCPTIPSRLLREKFGEPFLRKKLYYCYNFEDVNWSGVIKGGENDNLALKFYNEFLKKYPFGLSFIPECPMKDIFLDLTPNNYQYYGFVDFYSPLYNTIIEIDGKQHGYDEQKGRDYARDDYARRHGVKVIRIHTDDLDDENKINHILSRNIVRNFSNVFANPAQFKNVFRDNDLKYCFAIRIESLLVYLYGNKILNLSDQYVKLNLYSDFEINQKDFEIVVNNFYSWLNQLCSLLNLEFKIPQVKICICHNTDELLLTQGVKIDMSISKVYSNNIKDNLYYIRNDYFEYSKYYEYKMSNSSICYNRGQNYFKVATSDIDFKITKENHEENLRFVLENISTKYKEYRANQLDIIIEALNKRSVIGILPTGAGKSLCYQIVSVLLPAMTIVVAPLVILMNDQYEHLIDNFGLSQCIAISSENKEGIKYFSRGQSLITLVSPERFFNREFVNAIQCENNNKIGMVVIDEAHSLSEWGHDFRTSYLCLSHNLRNILSQKTLLMALTGSASHSVFTDIENEISYFKGSRPPSIYADDMRRNNLHCIVEVFDPQKKDAVYNALKENILATLLGENESKTLVFTKTINQSKGSESNYACMELYRRFADIATSFNKPIRCSYFISGMTVDDKKEVLHKFKTNTDTKILFATKAFGMGVDINDIRKTIHCGLPSSIEGLYQEIGRAGRDGENSNCYIYFKREPQYMYDLFFNSEITIDLINSRKDELQELGTNFYFLQKTNLDVEAECLLIKHVYELIVHLNKKGETSCLCLDIKDYLRSEIYEYNQVRDVLTVENAKIIIEKALYRLYLLGEIEMWSLEYVTDLSNPLFSNLIATQYLAEDKYNRLVGHIERYESRANAMPKENTFEGRVHKIVSWSYENYVLERIKSMRTLYDWCIDFADSDAFMGRLADYFSFDPVYIRLIDKGVTITNYIDAIKRKPDATKVRIARLLESYENIDALNFVSGITRLRLDEFEHFDGKRRLMKSFDGINTWSDANRMSLLSQTYNIIEEDYMKDVLVDSWLSYFPNDVYWIYENLGGEQAEKYIVANFTDKLLQLKEKIDARL